jgi:RNA polymerase sigma factor (sigma-70 family)
MTTIVSRPAAVEPQERELFLRAQAGDRAAVDELVRKHIGLIHLTIRKRSNRYSGPLLGHESDDLVSEGTIGLMRAIQLFDVDRGIRFSTYAMTWIAQVIDRGTRKMSGKLETDYGLGKRLLIRQVENELTSRLQREPTVEEIAEESRLNPDVVKRQRREVICDHFTDGDHESADSAPTRHQLDVVDMDVAIDVLSAIEHAYGLTPRQRAILKLHFGIGEDAPMSMAEVAELYSISVQTVATTVRNAIAILKRSPSLSGYECDD